MKREISGDSVDLNSSVTSFKEALSVYFDNSDIGRKDYMLRLWCFQVEVVFVQIREICAEFLPTSTFSHQEAGKIENQSRIAKI